MNNLLQQLNITTNNLELYLQALTHTSYAHENHTEHNERLEFLGDAVIELMMSTYLFTHDPSNQGVLTKRRAQAVREEALVLYAKKIDLEKHMRLGNGEQSAKPSMIADAFEAFFGAIYIDQGYEKAYQVFLDTVIPNLKLVEHIKDYKTQLQEFIQLERKSLSYKTIKVGGPSHRPVFKSEVYL